MVYVHFVLYVMYILPQWTHTHTPIFYSSQKLRPIRWKISKTQNIHSLHQLLAWPVSADRIQFLLPGLAVRNVCFPQEPKTWEEDVRRNLAPSPTLAFLSNSYPMPISSKSVGMPPFHRWQVCAGLSLPDMPTADAALPTASGDWWEAPTLGEPPGVASWWQASNHERQQGAAGKDVIWLTLKKKGVSQ